LSNFLQDVYWCSISLLGTNLGGASVDLETRMETWFLRCKSDVFAQQIINSVSYPFLF